MKKGKQMIRFLKILYHIMFILAVGFSNTLMCQQPSPAQKELMSPEQALNVFNEQTADLKTVADALFNPVFPNTTPARSNPYPTTSINESAIDALYGSALGVDADLLGYIKNFYFFLEYITKIECGARLASLGHQQNLDVISLLEKSGWQGFIDALVKKVGSFDAAIKAIDSARTAPDFQSIGGSIVVSSWANVVTTAFWKAIPVTAQMIINSSFWQDYCKYAVTKSFIQDASILQSIYDIDKSIFRFIPNIEVAFYHEDFIHMRNSAEFQRLHLILTDEARNRLLAQTTDWSKMIQPKMGHYDLVNIYNQSLEFKKTNFYILLSVADSSKLGDLSQQAIDKKLPVDPNYVRQPLVQERLLCIAMLKNLQAQTFFLFDRTHLQKTTQALANTTNKPMPSFLLYTQDDAVYLEDLDNLLTEFKAVAQSEATKTPQPKITFNNATRDEKVVVQDFGNWLHSTWKDVKKGGKDVYKELKDAGQTIADEAQAIGYITIAGIDSKRAKEYIQKSKKFQQRVQADITKAMSDGKTIVKDASNVAKDVTHGAAGIVGNVLSGIDPRLGKDVEGLIDAAADYVIDRFADAANLAITIEAGVIRLTTDAVNMATTIVVDAVVAAKTGDFSGLGSDMLNGIKTIAYDIVSNVLAVASFVGTMIIDAIKSMVKFAGYLISIVTDLSIDIFKATFNTFASIFSSFGWQAGADAANSAASWTANHRRLIEATITTGLLIAAVVATDGLALPILAMTVGPQVFQVIGGYQSDERSIARKQEQKQFVSDYQTYVANNKIISQNAKNAWQSELNIKYESQLINQERELGFYQNFLQSYFASAEKQMAYYLGQNLIPQIQKDQNGQIPADVGYIYGMKTDVFNLNPSQGFPLYNDGRKAFSQEIAVSAALAVQSDNQNITSSTPRKFWFNQKETIILPKDTQTVEIRWQAVYTLNTFYIGLWFGGKPIDFKAIQDSGSAPLDSAHLAKMLVYKKEGKDDLSSLNLYEHEGGGWLGKVSGPEFTVGSWYRMRLALNGSSLQATVWKEGNPVPGPQTFNVSPTDQRTIGIISSGASVEYQIITPTVSPQAVPQVRTTQNLGLPTEKDRSIAMRKQLQELKNPAVGSFNLQPADNYSILKGQYLYTTNATNLLDDAKKPLLDYVTLAQQGSRGDAKIVFNIGESPLTALSPGAQPPLVVSFVSQKAYDTKGNYVTTAPRVLETFIKGHGALSDETMNTITKLRQSYANKLIGPFNFGSIALQATSADEIINGHYIYRATSPESELHDSQNNPIKDSNGQPLYDYFLMKNQADILGVTYDQSIQLMRSLVTGLEYAPTSKTAKPETYDPKDTLNAYKQNTGPISQGLLDSINASQAFYKQKVNKEANQTVPAQTIQTLPNQQTASPSTGPYSGSPAGNPQTTNPSSADESIENRTDQASHGEEVSFGG